MRDLRIKWRLLRRVSATGKVASLLLTFFVGTAATLIYREFSAPTVTLCQLAQNPDFYRGKIVKVEADAVSVIGLVFISDKTCQLRDAAATVRLEKDFQFDEEVQKLYIKSDVENYNARIVVTGRFDPNADRGCYLPKAAIRATKIELKSAITTEPIEKQPEKVASKQELAASRFFSDFQKAVAGNHKKQVAAMMQYPLRVNFYTEPRPTEYHFIENQAEFLKVYDRVFAHSVKDYIAKFNPEKVWGNDYFMQTDTGEIGIAVSCKDNNRDCDYDFKIKIIHSNSIEIDYLTELCGGGIDCFIKVDAEQNKRPQN